MLYCLFVLHILSSQVKLLTSVTPVQRQPMCVMQSPRRCTPKCSSGSCSGLMPTSSPAHLMNTSTLVRSQLYPVLCAPVFTLSYEENSPMPKSSFLGQCLLSRPVDRIERGGELDYEILCNILVGASR